MTDDTLPSVMACLYTLLARAFAACGLPTSARAVPASRPEFGDFQCNAAMAAAKTMRRSPRELATAVAVELRQAPEFACVEVAGPGFINLRLANGFLEAAAQAQAASPTLGVSLSDGPATFIDFGGPNVAKPLHVGHLRSLVIGESLRRILQARGLVVTSDIHLGDWGLQMGMLIAAVRHAHPGREHGEAGALVSIDEMQRLYPEAAAACKADPVRMGEARALTAALQAGDAAASSDWAALRATSLADQRRDIDALGAHFDLYLGESDAQPFVDRLVSSLAGSGLAVRDTGALVIDVAEPSDSQPVPPLILVKSDGAATYATTDLATIAMRAADTGPCRYGRMVYVVDQRQALHFRQVFHAARRAELAPGAEFVHVGFGTVNGADGKPYRTRDGGVARLRDLLADAVAKARERVGGTEPDLDAGRLAVEVGLAAVKWADLQTHRLSGYSFDPDRMVSFEGRTGPYVQYACVRIRSITARAGGAEAGPIRLGHPAERVLALACLYLPDAVAAAADGYAPNEVADLAFAVAQAFSRFYAECPVIGAQDAATRASRLALCGLAEAVLGRALFLLGITVPERM